MPPAAVIEVSLKVMVGEDPIRGEFARADASGDVAFCGWVELVSLLDEARTAGAGAGANAQPPESSSGRSPE